MENCYTREQIEKAMNGDIILYLNTFFLHINKYNINDRCRTIVGGTVPGTKVHPSSK